jgi:hypothetical protein
VGVSRRAIAVAAASGSALGSTRIGASIFRKVRHGQGVGPGLEEGPPGLGGAEAVPVGLDHREDAPGGADLPADGAQVVADGVEVDLEPGRAERVHHLGVYRTPVIGATTLL